ncbi:hypothetical protein Trydic_g13797 [Trypoxylus dichotomus]
MDESHNTSGGESPPKKKAKKKIKIVRKSKGTKEQVSLPSINDTLKPSNKTAKENDEEFKKVDVTDEKMEEVDVSSTDNTNVQEYAVHLKLEDYSRNDLFQIVVDEVSLEGLDGITIEALWTRLSRRISSTIPFPDEFQNTVWEVLTNIEKIKFYLLPKARPKLVIYNRFMYIDWDTGHLAEPDEVPEDIYPFVPISEEDGQNECFGSCADFKTRVNISEEIRQMTLTQANNKYGSLLVIVADQVLRNKALGLEQAKSLDKLLNVHYCMLERIGRGRTLGEVTAGRNSLQQMSQSKTLFYLRKTLLANGLITKQCFYIKSQKGYTSALLFHLTRFYKPHKPTKLVLMEQIIDILKKKPDHRIEYLELKKLVGYEVWTRGMQKLMKSAEFRQYVQTDVLVPYRTMYPNAPQKEWKVKNGSKEKLLRILQLINPTVHLPAYSKEEDVKEESSDDEPLCEYAYNETLFNQAYKLVSQAGPEGVSLRQVQRKLGLDFYTARSILTSMIKRNLLETKNVDIGRIHILKYYIPTVSNGGVNLKPVIKETPSTSKEETDGDTLSFIADVLEVSKEDLVAKKQESDAEESAPESEPENPFKGHFDFIRECRTRNRLERYARKCKGFQGDGDEKSPDEKKLQAEEREKLEAIFKNDHPYYPMELSLQYGKIEPWKLNIKIDEEFGEILKAISNSEKEVSRALLTDYDYEGTFESAALDDDEVTKLTTLPQLFKMDTLIGSAEKASGIVRNYLFLPVNPTVDTLLKRFQSVVQDIRTRSLKSDVEFPDDLLSDEETNINSESKDSASLEVQVEDGKQDEENKLKSATKEEEEVKDFKTRLLKNFEDFNCVLGLENEKTLFVESTTSVNNEKRKDLEIEENSNKRIKLEPKVEKDQKGEEREESVHIAQDPAVLLKNITDTVKMEIYMGDEPTLLSHCLDEDNIQTTIICTKDADTCPESQTYVNKAASQISVTRANFILETVYREKVISDTSKFLSAIKAIEREKKHIGVVDRKSVDRLLRNLTTAGHIKIFKIILKYENVIRCKNIVCLASVDATSTLQVYIDQLKIAFFIYAKKKTDSTRSTLSSIALEVIPPLESGPIDSYDEIVALTSNQKRPQYKHSRIVAKQYGYVPKFAKIKVMHELLFYLIYNYDGKAVDSKDVPSVLRQFHVKLSNDNIEELGTLYRRELSWKMFIPPLPKYKEWSGGWALICDIILRLPLSVFVKIFNISYVIPDLLSLLSDPIRKHVLLKNVPADIRNACLHNRRCIFSIHEILCQLCYMGLLQFGVQKLKEKEQQFIYLNRRAILYDTTSSEPGYLEITPKEYPVFQFYFENQSMLDNYWSKLWSVSMSTKLGQRSAMLEKTITMQDIHTKPEMVQSVMPKSPGGALEADVGYIPGDHRGVCCLDSSIRVHVKRNWIWSNTIRRIGKGETPTTAPGLILGMRRKHLDQVKFKSIKYKDLARELNKKKLKKATLQSEPRIETKVAIKRSKKHPFTKKVLPRLSKRSELFKYDDLDKRIMNKMRGRRAIWSDEEDVNIFICHYAKKFLMNNSGKKIIPGLVIRDVMHRLCPNKRKKTTSAYSRRCHKLIKTDKSHSSEEYSYLLENDKNLQKIFSRFRTKIAAGETIPEADVNIAFIYLASYVANIYKSKFINKQRILDDRYFDYLNEKDISKYLGQDSTNTELIYENPQTIDAIKSEVIKDIIHCSLSWKSETSESPLMLYRTYQQYPDHLLRDAISWMRKKQIIAGKKTGVKHSNVKEGISMAGKLIHNSFVYSFKQITKYPDHIYPEAYQMFISIYNKHNVQREFLVDKYEQGHGLGFSEVVCLHDVIFSFKVPDDMLVLDPKITDHSQLIQELAVRYKFLLQQKTNPQESDDHEQKSTPGASDNVKDVEKAIEVIFEAQKQKSSVHTGSKLIDSVEDDVELTGSEIPSTSKAVNIQNETLCENIETKPATQEQESRNSGDKNQATLEALQHLTSYLGNKQDDDFVKVSDLAYLLTKGLFPELDDDEERLEKLNRHFLILYPSSTFCTPETLVGKDWAEEILANGRTKGDEIQEMIKGECIIKNTSQDEEVSNSLIDLGGDDEDIKLAFAIVTYIKHKGTYGTSSSELKREFQSKTQNLELYEIVNVLIKVGMLFRTGVREIRLVHVTENETWTIGLDDERPISEINLNSLGLRLKLMPWIRINGTLNLKVLHNWMYVILSYCLSSPFAMLSTMLKRFNILKPVDIFSLLEYLQTLGCIRIYTYVQVRPVTLLSTTDTTEIETRPANILDDFEAIFIETDKMAVTKMGALRYKGQINIDIPFEE